MNKRFFSLIMAVLMAVLMIVPAALAEDDTPMASEGYYYVYTADGKTLNVSTQKNANAAINVLDNAIQKALDQQTTIGAIESRLEYTSTNLTTASENVTASESTIRDADMAKEMTEYTKDNVIAQAGTSALSQANELPQMALQLLQ